LKKDIPGHVDAVRRLRADLRQLLRLLGVLDREEARCCGMSLAQCNALLEVASCPGLSVSDLAERLLLDRSTASRLVDRLVSQGLLKRELSPEDRRRVTLTPSEEGWELVGGVERSMDEWFESALAFLSEDERRMVFCGLELLLKVLDGTSPEGCHGRGSL